LLLRASLDRPLALELIADLEALSDSQKTPHPSLSSELRIKSLFIVAAWYLVQASRTNQVDEPTRERNRTASKQAFERAKALGDVSRYAFLQAMLLEQEGQREAATDLLANISDN